MHQWISELEKFLVIHEEPPQYITPKGRIKTRDSAIGTMAADYDNAEHILFMITQMRGAGIGVVTTEEYGNHYAVIDDSLVWHGGMNLLGKEDAWDNLMRINDPDAAQELLLMAQNVVSFDV